MLTSKQLHKDVEKSINQTIPFENHQNVNYLILNQLGFSDFAWNWEEIFSNTVISPFYLQASDNITKHSSFSAKAS